MVAVLALLLDLIFALAQKLAVPAGVGRINTKMPGKVAPVSEADKDTKKSPNYLQSNEKEMS